MNNMEFVDYKCLESLLIEGEELIATEGIGNMIKGFISKFFRIIHDFFRAIASIFYKIGLKIRHKKILNGSSSIAGDGVTANSVKLNMIANECTKCSFTVYDIVDELTHYGKLTVISNLVNRLKIDCEAYNELTDKFIEQLNDKPLVIAAGTQKNVSEVFEKVAIRCSESADKMNDVIKKIEFGMYREDEATELQKYMNSVTKYSQMILTNVNKLIPIVNSAIIR